MDRTFEVTFRDGHKKRITRATTAMRLALSLRDSLPTNLGRECAGVRKVAEDTVVCFLQEGKVSVPVFTVRELLIEQRRKEWQSE